MTGATGLSETPDAELAAHRNATATKWWVGDRILDLARQLAEEEAGALGRRTRELVERLLLDVSAVGADELET